MPVRELLELRRILHHFHPAQFLWNREQRQSSFRSNYISRGNFLNFPSGPGANVPSRSPRSCDFCDGNCWARTRDLGGSFNTGNRANAESRCRRQQLPPVQPEAPAAPHKFGADTTKGLTVAIQGLGKVGMGLAKRLHEEGAKLIVADVSEDAVRRAVDAFGARRASTDSVVTTECDVFSPNALGAILGDETVMALKAKVVAGGANNQLARDLHGKILMERGVLYAPDYVINGGGIIRVAGQIYDWEEAEVERRAFGIADTLSAIFKRADAEHEPTNVIADRMAEERIARGAGLAAKAAE